MNQTKRKTETEFRESESMRRGIRWVSGFVAIREAYSNAKEAAWKVNPTSPAGAAALLSIIDTDEPFIPSIIAALEGMANG